MSNRQLHLPCPQQQSLFYSPNLLYLQSFWSQLTLLTLSSKYFQIWPLLTTPPPTTSDLLTTLLLSWPLFSSHYYLTNNLSQIMSLPCSPQWLPSHYEYKTRALQMASKALQDYLSDRILWMPIPPMLTPLQPHWTLHCFSNSWGMLFT